MRKIRKDAGNLWPTIIRHANEKAISVATGIAQPFAHTSCNKQVHKLVQLCRLMRPVPASTALLVILKPQISIHFISSVI